MNTHINGLIAAPSSPMKQDGSLNLRLIPEYAKRLADNNLSGVFICGSTGEGASLSISERMSIAETWINYAPQQLKIIVHVGATSQIDAIELAKNAQGLGAYAIAATGPAYYKPSNAKQLAQFIKPIAQSASNLPFYYYHIPGLNHNNISVYKFLKEASDIQNLAGVKYTHEDEMEYKLCSQYKNGKYDILYGRDETLICGLVLGAKGGVGSTYNYIPALYYKIIDAFNSGDLNYANELQVISMQIIQVYLKYGGIPAGKAIMQLVGLDCGPVRSPLTSLNAKEIQQMEKELKKIGFYDWALK